MRALDINRQLSLLTEGLMSNDDWTKEYYLEPFIENVAENQPYSFSVKGENFTGIVQNGAEVAQQIKNAYLYYKKNKDADLLKAIRFDVDVLDDDTEEADGTTVENLKLNQIFKDEKIKGELELNLGNIAEMVLGCAVTAKFENPTGMIDIESLKDVGRRLADGKGEMNSSSGKDAITFIASVPFSDRKGFYAYLSKDSRGKSLKDYNVKPDTIKSIDQHVASAVEYVNTSKRVAIAVGKAANDPSENEVEVISDGGNAEQQKTTKVDLKILVDNKAYNLLSIKAGDVKQVGQNSGYLFENLDQFFADSVAVNLNKSVQDVFLSVDPNAVGKKAITAEKQNVRQANYDNGFVLAYDYVANELQKLAKKNQLELLERVYHGLIHHTTRHEKNVEMVILNPSAKRAFSELTFGKELREALNDYRLVVYRKHGNSMHEIDIFGFPVTDTAKREMGTGKELLVKFRSYMQKGGVRNIVEMGSLLKELADWEKIDEKKAVKKAAAAVQRKAAGATQTKAIPDKQLPDVPEPPEPPKVPDELAAIKKNAGITPPL